MKNGKQPYIASAATELQGAIWFNKDDDDFQILENLQLMI